jgi:hypothetical protein
MNSKSAIEITNFRKSVDNWKLNNKKLLKESENFRIIKENCFKAKDRYERLNKYNTLKKKLLIQKAPEYGIILNSRTLELDNGKKTATTTTTESDREDDDLI